MQLEVLLNNEEALINLSKLPLKDAQLAWDISEALDVAKAHLKKFHEKRDELAVKHGKPMKDDPTKFEMDLKTGELFNEEVEKLSKVVIKLKFPTIQLKMLNGLQVSPAEISSWRELKILTK